MTPRLWGWVGLLTVAVAYEAWGLLDPSSNDTLSELTAHVFKTTTRAGAVAFALAWVLFAAWFLGHICINQGHWRKPAATPHVAPGGATATKEH